MFVVSELLQSMKTFYLHYVRIRNATSSTARTRKIVSSPGQSVQYVPIAVNGKYLFNGKYLLKFHYGYRDLCSEWLRSLTLII
jgi:hypothetical protein